MDVVLIEQFHEPFKDKGLNQDLLRFNVAHTRCNFHVITDQNREVPGVEYHPIKEYGKTAQDFDSNFTNFSTLPTELTRRFIRRWIIINAFVKRHNLKRLIATDNDILFGSDPSSWPIEVRTADFCLSRGHSAHTNHISNPLVLEAFEDYVLTTYRNKNKENFKYFQGIGKYFQENNLPGGVCDMAFWASLKDRHSPSLSPLMDIAQVFNNKETFDHTLDSIEEYESTKEGVKKVEFIGGVPYSYHKELNKMVKFNTLHFQGHTKDKIAPFLKRASRS
jgi:hypothetical protein